MLNLKNKILSISLAASALVIGTTAAFADGPAGSVLDPNPAVREAAVEAREAVLATVEPDPVSLAPMAEFEERQGYTPTVLHSYREVLDLYMRERLLNHGSQCHQRAEVWSNDLHAATGDNLMKVMMFYTPKFRSTFQHKGAIYEWWYHTAPVVYADLGKGPIAFVLDREFLKYIGPVTLDEWSHFFLHDEIVPNNSNIPYVDKILGNNGQYLSTEQTHCEVIGNFRDYAVPALRLNMNTPWCMMRIYPMFYMQPDDVMQMDCDPRIDANYTQGLTPSGLFSSGGAAVLATFDRGPLKGHYKRICPKGDPNTLKAFKQSDLDMAYKHATPRPYDKLDDKVL